MAGKNQPENNSSIPPMDLGTLYAGGDWEYLSDDRSTENTDDDTGGAGDEGLPPPINETKRKKEKEEADGETDDETGDEGNETEDDTGSEGDESKTGDKGKTGETGDGSKSKTGDDTGDGTGEEEGANRVGSVPKWRLDQQTKKLRQSEREAEALRAQLEKLTGKKSDGQQSDTSQQQQPQNDSNAEYAKQVKDLQTKRNEIRDQYEEAIIDGDTKKTKALREQLDAVEDDIFEVRVSARTQQVKDETVTQSSIERELQVVADKVQSQYTPLDPNHESYDEELVTEVVAYRDMLINRLGRKPGEALQEAAETMAKKYDIPSEEGSNTETPPAGKKRTEERSRGKEKVAQQQPPKMPGKRNEPKVSDIASMTDKEFDKLTPEQRAELRGDYRVS